MYSIPAVNSTYLVLQQMLSAWNGPAIDATLYTGTIEIAAQWTCASSPAPLGYLVLQQSLDQTNWSEVPGSRVRVTATVETSLTHRWILDMPSAKYYRLSYPGGGSTTDRLAAQTFSKTGG